MSIFLGTQGVPGDGWDVAQAGDNLPETVWHCPWSGRSGGCRVRLRPPGSPCNPPTLLCFRWIVHPLQVLIISCTRKLIFVQKTTCIKAVSGLFISKNFSSSCRLPVGYYFTKALTGEQLQLLALKVMASIEEAGFRVIRLVGDNHSSNCKVFSNLSGGSIVPVVTWVQAAVRFRRCRKISDFTVCTHIT